MEKEEFYQQFESLEARTIRLKKEHERSTKRLQKIKPKIKFGELVNEMIRELKKPTDHRDPNYDGEPNYKFVERIDFKRDPRPPYNAKEIVSSPVPALHDQCPKCKKEQPVIKTSRYVLQLGEEHETIDYIAFLICGNCEVYHEIARN